jgi:hypothetical protein
MATTEKDLKINIRSSVETGGLDRAEKSTGKFKESIKSVRDSLRGLAYDIPGIGPLVERVFTPMGAAFTAISAAIGLVIQDIANMRSRIREAATALEADEKKITAWKESLTARSEDKGFLDDLKELSAEADRAVQYLRTVADLKLQIGLDAIENDASLTPTTKAERKISLIRSSRAVTEARAGQLILDADNARIGALQGIISGKPQLEADIGRREIVERAKAKFRQEAEVSSAINAPGVVNTLGQLSTVQMGQFVASMFGADVGAPTPFTSSVTDIRRMARGGRIPTGAELESANKRIITAEGELPGAVAARSGHIGAAFDRMDVGRLTNQLEFGRIRASAAKDAVAIAQQGAEQVAQFMQSWMQMVTMLNQGMAQLKQNQRRQLNP